jgi:hypothetical protein
VNIFKTILKLTQVTTKKAVTAITLITSSIAISIATPAYAAPQGDFGIVTNNGNRVDVYGDYLPSYKGPMHLWKAIYSSNIYTLGPNEGTGNEIRLKVDPTICITPDVPLGVKPSSGTPLVAKRDCANSYNFKFEGGKIYMGRYPDMCLDIPNNNDVVRQTLQVHSCNGSPAQQFNTGGQSNSNQQNNQKTIVNQWNDYEYWILSYRRGNKLKWKKDDSQFFDVGHAWNAIIKKTNYRYSDGSTSDSGWNVYRTFAFNPYPSNPNQDNLDIGYENNSNDESRETKLFLEGNMSKFPKGIEVRKSRISETRALWIANQPRTSGCSKYDSNKPNLFFIEIGSNKCNCVDFATRNWFKYSANWEDFRPKTAQPFLGIGGAFAREMSNLNYYSLFTIPASALSILDSTDYNLTPDALADSLKNKNNNIGSQFLDSGNIWQ